MTRRRFLLFGLLSGSLALAVGIWLFVPRTAITRENAAKIQSAMPMREVEALLGGPARDESTGRLVQTFMSEGTEGWVLTPGALAKINRSLSRRIWVSNEVVVIVEIEQQFDRVSECDVWHVRRVSGGPLEMLRRWFRL